MSEATVSAQEGMAATGPLSGGRGQYNLSDELARLCLPQEFKDSYRTLAWVNSICALFLLVGLVGLKPPKVIVRPLSPPPDTMQVEFTPPPEPPKPQEQPPPEQPQDQPPDTPQEMPQIAQVVAAADTANVAFAVPVQGAVAIAKEARMATPPPPINHAPAAPVRFNPAVSDGGSYPPPSYPGIALRNHEEGTTSIEIVVDESGKITSAKVQKSSGYPELDSAALDVVKRSWRFPPGKPRWLYWPCTFKME